MVSYWFAWFPVKTDLGWRWLCKVERLRRDNHILSSEGHRSWWEYLAVRKPSRETN